MRLIISPAKKMRVDTDSFPCPELPQFLPQTQRLLDQLRQLSPQQLKSLWKCSDQIAALNQERLARMDLRRGLTPALLAYEGIQYRCMAPGVFTQQELDYVAQRLRLLSGFYGLLRPFDGVTPYRLEMGAKLAVDGCKDLYEFWGDALARALCQETTLIINLASKEYSRAVAPHLPSSITFLTCVFGEEQGGKIVEKGTLCKMARGDMVRWMAQRRVEDPEELKEFDWLGYRFRPEHSDEKTYVFVKEKAYVGSGRKGT